MVYLLDTDWAIDALRRRESRMADLGPIAPAQISVSRVTVAELYEGAFGSVDPQR
jgi:predicted nucleic acid-binding protein